jgi:hypothetical protein
MLALIYLALAIYIGDFLCRRFHRFVSIGQRSAAAVITGLLISSWFTYLAGLLFARAKQPLFWGNVVVLCGRNYRAILSLWKRKVAIKRRLSCLPQPTDSDLRVLSETSISFTLMVHHIVLCKLKPEVTLLAWRR